MRVHKRCGAAVCALALAVTLVGCDGRVVPVTAEFDRGFGFTFDSSFGTSVQVTLTQSDILGSLDIPDGATVAFVDIQRVRLGVAENPRNEASTTRLRFSYQGEAFTEDLDITVADLEDEPVGALVASTLREVERDVRAILAGDPSAPAEVTMAGEIFDIVAPGSRLVLDVTLSMKATVSYEFCEEIGLGPFGPNAECTVS
jgi:hypothetical protein